jgi:hypothetical protein
LVVETGVRGENHRPTASHWKTFSHNVVFTEEVIKQQTSHKRFVDKKNSKDISSPPQIV